MLPLVERPAPNLVNAPKYLGAATPEMEISPWHVSLLRVVKPEGGIDPIIICPHDSAIPFQQARRRQSIDIVVDPAVVALELLGKGSNAPDRMTVNVFEKLPSLGSQERTRGLRGFRKTDVAREPFCHSLDD